MKSYKNLKYCFTVLLLGIGMALAFTACGSGGDGNLPPVVPGEKDLKGMELIEQDYKDQAIDYESYLVYKTQYIFGDPALPDKYRDQTLTPDGTALFNQISTVFSTLSENCRQTLAPYLLRPDDPNSYIYQTITSGATAQMTTSSFQFTEAEYRPDDLQTFKYIDTSDDYLRIWYPDVPDDPQNDKYKQQAQDLAADLDGVAYARFYNLLGEKPPPDGQLGGNERLDLYLIHPRVMEIRVWRGVNLPDYSGINMPDYQPNTKPSSFSIIKANYTREEIRGVTAHEMFHMFQRNYDYDSNDKDEWWTEATAQFAMQLVFPDDDTERWAIDDFMQFPKLTLTSVNANHEYGAYLFPFFLVRSFGEPFYASIWQDIDGKSFSSIEAIENRLGSFDDEWKEFVLWNTVPDAYYGENRPFTENHSYLQFDASRWFNIVFPGRTTVDIPALDPLSAYVIDVWLDDNFFKHISFTNLDDFNNQGTNTAIQALIVDDPDATIPTYYEDWSELSKRDYFITQRSDKICRVVLILSNAHPKEKTTPSRLFIDTDTSGDFSLNHSETRIYSVFYYFEGIWRDFNLTLNIDGNFVGPGVISDSLQASPCLGLYQASWSVTGLPSTLITDPLVTRSGTITFDLGEAYDNIRYGFSDNFIITKESGDAFGAISGSLVDWDENGATISLPYSVFLGRSITCPGCNDEAIDETPVYIKIVKN